MQDMQESAGSEQEPAAQFTRSSRKGPVPLREENLLREEKGKKAPPAGGVFPGLAAHTKD